MTDILCMSEFIQIVPLDRASDDMEVKQEDLQDMKLEPDDEYDSPYCSVNDEPVDKYHAEHPCPTAKVGNLMRRTSYDDSCMAEFLELIPLDRASDDMEIKQEDLQDVKLEPDDEYDSPYYSVNDEPVDEYDTECPRSAAEVGNLMCDML